MEFLAPLRLGIVGTGGFSLHHHRILRRLEGESICRLLCTCDPSVENLAGAEKELAFSERGVAVYQSLEEMLHQHGRELDGIILPTPLPLHASMHALCVQAGIPCYLEKPPTLYLPEYEEMMSVEHHAKRPTQIGFNYCENKTRQLLRQRMEAGDFGNLRKVSFEGLWPRGKRYYDRSSWAGRLHIGEKPVLDSCLGNAFSHFVVQLLRWASIEKNSMALCPLLTAELYRANSIESFDTAYVKAQTNTDIKLMIATSHACYPIVRNEEVLFFEKAKVVYNERENATIYWNSKKIEKLDMDQQETVEVSLRSFIKMLRAGAQPIISLADCRPFIEFITLTFLSGSPIQEISENFWNSLPITPNDSFRSVNGLSEISSQSVESERLPSEMGIPWASPRKTCLREDLKTVNFTSFIQKQIASPVPHGI